MSEWPNRCSTSASRSRRNRDHTEKVLGEARQEAYPATRGTRSGDLGTSLVDFTNWQHEKSRGLDLPVGGNVHSFLAHQEEATLITPSSLGDLIPVFDFVNSTLHSIAIRLQTRDVEPSTPAMLHKEHQRYFEM